MDEMLGKRTTASLDISSQVETFELVNELTFLSLVILGWVVFGNVDRYTSHVIFSHSHCTRFNDVQSHIMAQVSARTRHPILMPSMMSG